MGGRIGRVAFQHADEEPDCRFDVSLLVENNAQGQAGIGFNLLKDDIK